MFPCIVTTHMYVAEKASSIGECRKGPQWSPFLQRWGPPQEEPRQRDLVYASLKPRTYEGLFRLSLAQNTEARIANSDASWIPIGMKLG